MGKNTRIFWLLWCLCIVGAWALIPYLYSSQIVPSDSSKVLLFSLITMQAAVVFGIACWISSKLIVKTDLHPFVFAQPMKTIVYPGILWGTVVSLTLFLFDHTLFSNSLLANRHSSFWTGALASIYGAVNEEVLMRLFLLTLFYFYFRKWFGVSRKSSLWVATFIVAILFGVGHLPAAFKFGSPSSLEITRILLLNGIAGVIFGWLYWSKSFWAALCAHFTADIFLHALFNVMVCQ